MVRELNNKKKEADEISIKSQSAPKRTKKNRMKTAGRPKKCGLDYQHQHFYSEVISIYETLAYLIKILSQKSRQHQNRQFTFQYDFLTIQQIFQSPKFEQLKLSSEQKKRYGNKYTLTYWVKYYFLCQQNKTNICPEQMLDLIIYWLIFQKVLTTLNYNQLMKIKNNAFDELVIMNRQTVRNTEILNLVIILTIELAAFQDLNFVIKTKNDEKICLIKETEAYVTNQSMRVFSSMMGGKY